MGILPLARNLCLFDHQDVRQVTVFFCIIDPVTHDEAILDGKADVVTRDVHFSSRLLVDQGDDAQALGIP